MATSATMEQDEYATTAEASEALRRLSDADLLRLEKIARYRSFAHPLIDPRDLLNEAVVRVLRGTRRWPRSVPIVRFLANVLRSLATEAWRQESETPERLESSLPTREGHAQADYLAESKSYLPNPEETALEVDRQRLIGLSAGELLNMFRNDPTASSILQGLREGLTPDQIRNQHGMTTTEYGTARRRIRRLIDRRFPKGASL